MRVNVTFSANAGVAIAVGKYRIWVDALHTRKQPGFSAAGPRILDDSAFFRPGHICYTHCHGDHFSETLTRIAAQRWPEAKVYLPERILPNQETVAPGNLVFRDGALTLRFFPLPHEGAQYAQVPHYGLLITVDGCNILAAGDCATGSPALLEALDGEQVDLAILDFPWITLAKGRAALKKLAPRQILVCHLPFAWDDVNGYRESALRSAQGLSNVRLLLEPLQREEYIFG